MFVRPCLGACLVCIARNAPSEQQPAPIDGQIYAILKLRRHAAGARWTLQGDTLRAARLYPPISHRTGCGAGPPARRIRSPCPGDSPCSQCLLPTAAAAAAACAPLPQGHFFEALRHVRLVPADAEPAALRYSRCGRTDRGVSALEQVGRCLLARLLPPALQTGRDPRACACVPCLLSAQGTTGKHTLISQSTHATKHRHRRRARFLRSSCAPLHAPASRRCRPTGKWTTRHTSTGAPALLPFPRLLVAHLLCVPPAALHCGLPVLQASLRRVACALNQARRPSTANRRALPDDIRVLGWADVDDSFNARWGQYSLRMSKRASWVMHICLDLSPHWSHSSLATSLTRGRVGTSVC